MFDTSCFVSANAAVTSSSSSAFVSICRKRERGNFSTAQTPCRRAGRIPCMTADEGKPTEDRNDGRATSGLFGIRLRTNGDVIKFGIVAIAIAYGFKTVLQLLGTPDLLAGQLTTGFISVLSLLAWVSTYAFRVGTKGMTYAQQLRDYEDEVIKKRYEELTDEELAALKEELEDDI